ncbi:MAG: HAD family phosphatase [Saprospiraceae bacterium]|nr:HAD family phosphatase [Bacteroidia bacterium]NNE13713.1 HAD family phosphatase [Saprospiraceae bacterium]
MIDANKNTIIFDFGNVLIDLDFERCYQALENVLNVDWSSRKLPQIIIDAIHKYDRGQINDEELIAAFQNFNPNANPNDIIYAWNSLIGEIPNERFDLLNELKDDFNLCILSNINNLHINFITDYLETKHTITDFEDRFFNKVFYSHLIGKRKPDEEIYKYVTETLSAEPSQILFIDDMDENIEAAINFGWNGRVHKPGSEITEHIGTYLSETGFK